MFQFTQSVSLVMNPSEVTESRARVTNRQIAEVLYNIATLLNMQHANPYRVAAYRNAANRLMALAEPVSLSIARGEALCVPGIGERLRRKITELVLTGHMTFYDDLCEESLPADVRRLLAVEHVGPRTALRLAGQLRIHSIEQLYNAARAGRLRAYYGFGARSELRLAEAARAALDGARSASATGEAPQPSAA